MAELIKEWKVEDSNRSFFLRPCTTDVKDEFIENNVVESEDEDGDELFGLSVTNEDVDAKKHSFLYVHQEKWQQELIVKYGNSVSLMDATYKTTKYNLPLFFVCVLTNSGYKIVGKYVKKGYQMVTVTVYEN